MKFKDCNGELYVILEPKDKLNVCYLNEFERIQVTTGNNGLDITGNADVINSIYGAGMMEKVKIPKTLSQEDIYQMLDQWLNSFTYIYYLLKEIVNQSDINQQTKIKLTWNKARKFISLDLYHLNMKIIDGAIIKLEKFNEEIYDYLFAATFSFYLNKEYPNQQVEIKTLSKINNDTLKVLPVNSAAIDASLIFFENNYGSLENKIRAFHNINNPSDQLLYTLKSKIDDQLIYDNTLDSLSQTLKQQTLISDLYFNQDNKEVIKKLKFPKSN